jgi:hypothetical protein
MRKKTKHISWIKNTLVYTMRMSGNVLCYLNIPDTPHPDENALNYAHICELQQEDEQLLALQVKYPDNYVNLQLDDNVNDIICYKKDPTQPNWKIVLPKSMVVDTVKWFHQVMGHPNEKYYVRN